ncbi:MAG TPA: hypothetical protein VIJ51_12725 [Solirubrobacteraceae bacterium]
MTLSRGSRPAIRGATFAAVLIAAALAGPVGVPAQASASSLSQVRTVYRGVLTAEYFGPSSGVCGRLSASGRASFTAGGGGTCAHVFATEQHVLRHKVPGVDDSGYTATQWRQVVDQVMAMLTVTLHGATKASAIGPSGIPGRTHLVKTGGRWLFTSYPPTIES